MLILDILIIIYMFYLEFCQNIYPNKSAGCTLWWCIYLHSVLYR